MRRRRNCDMHLKRFAGTQQTRAKAINASEGDAKGAIERSEEAPLTDWKFGRLSQGLGMECRRYFEYNMFEKFVSTFLSPECFDQFRAATDRRFVFEDPVEIQRAAFSAATHHVKQCMRSQQ